MKILMLCDFYDESLQYQENLLAKYYTKHNHEVTIIASTYNSAFYYLSNNYNKKDPAREYFDNRAKIIKQPYSINILNKLRSLKNVPDIIQDEKPDIIFVHDIHLNISDAVGYKKQNTNCKIILDYHGDYSNSAKNWLSLNILHKVIRKFILYRAKRWIDKIYYITPSTGIFLHEVYGIAYKEMNLLPLGVDIDLANEIRKTEERNSVRSQLNIAEDDVVIFTGGKLTPAKKTHILIEAFRNLSIDKLHLLIIGDVSEEEKKYKKHLVKMCNGDDRIKFTGWVNGSEVYRYMNISDMAIFPSSQSVLWQQAISMGLPLIVGQLNNQDISYLNKYDNIIILAGNQIESKDIANNIKRLVNDRLLLNRMKSSALKTSAEILDYNKLVAQTLYFVNENSEKLIG